MAVAVEATTQGQGRITSAVVMVKVDMAVGAMEAMASRVAMAMDSRVDMEAMAVAMEEMEADTQEVDTVVVVAEEVEGGIRYGVMR